MNPQATTSPHNPLKHVVLAQWAEHWQLSGQNTGSSVVRTLAAQWAEHWQLNPVTLGLGLILSD